MNPENLTIEALNNDCLHHIYKYLTIVDIFKMQYLSKRFYKFAEGSKIHVKSIDFDLIFQEILKNEDDPASIKKKLNLFIKKILNNCEGNILKELKIKEKHPFVKMLKDSDLKKLFIKFDNMNSITLEGLSIAGNSFQNIKANAIKELSLANCQITKLINLLNFTSKLKNLNKLSISNSKEAEEIVETLSECKDLSEIFIKKQYNRSMLISYEFLCKQKELRVLQIKGDEYDNEPVYIYEEDEKGFEDLLPDSLETLELDALYLHFKFGHLKNLKIFKCLLQDLLDVNLHDIKNCMNLEEIEISFLNFNFKRSNGPINFFKNLSKLKSMTLKDLEGFGTGKFINFLENIKNCSELRNMKLVNWRFDRSEKRNIGSIENLTRLDFSEMDISDDDVIYLVKKLIKLEKLSFAECENVTNYSIKKAFRIKKKRGDSVKLEITSSECSIWPDQLELDISSLISLYVFRSRYEESSRESSADSIAESLYEY